MRWKIGALKKLRILENKKFIKILQALTSPL